MTDDLTDSAPTATVVEVNAGSAFVCPVEGCGKRFGPLHLLLDHLRESMFGGHDLDVTGLSVRVAYQIRQKKPRWTRCRKAAKNG